jgi:stage V sporulation protein B
MAGGLILLARPLTWLLYGESGAAQALQVLAVGSPVLAIQQVMGSSLQASGHGWVTVRNLTVGACVKFGLTWWLTPLAFWGIRGAALGTVCAAVTTAYLNWRDWTVIVGQSSNPFRSIVWPLAGTVVMAMGLNLWRSFPLSLARWSHTALAVLLGVFLYTAVLVASGEMRTVLNALKDR